MNWSADSIQVAIFTLPGRGQPEALQLWPVIFPGETPDNFQRGQVGPSAVTVSSGLREGANILLQSQIGRIDLRATANDRSEELKPPQIEDTVGMLSKLVGLAHKLLPEVEPVRIGITLNTSYLIENERPSDALERVLEGRAKFPADTIDLVHQFNKPYTIRSVGVPANRICTWLTGEHQFFSFDGKNGPGAHSLSFPFVAFNLDFNTSGGGKFSRDMSVTILDELLAEMVETIERGVGRFE